VLAALLAVTLSAVASTDAPDRALSLLPAPKGLAASPLARMKVPEPPSVQGCYVYEGGWRPSPCRSQAYVRHLPHPEFLPAITYKQATGATNKKGEPPLPINDGAIWIQVSKLGGLTDNMYGKGAFSIQLNSNGFNGTNGDRDWVQFVDQSEPNAGDALCIWQVIVTTSDYSHARCGGPTGNRPRGIQAGHGAELFADYNNWPGHTQHMLKLLAYLPWYSTAKLYSVVWHDDWGLTRTVGHTGTWNELFGSILGRGFGSTADFTKTKLSVTLASVDCITDACLADPGPASEASTNRAVKLSAGTGEGNNLLPTVNFGPTTTALPALQCLVVASTPGCVMSYTDTAP